MNRRQAHALTHPLNDTSGRPEVMRQYAQDRPHRTGLLLRTILAVDR